MLTEQLATELALLVHKRYQESLAIFVAQSINLEQATKQALASNKKKVSTLCLYTSR